MIKPFADIFVELADDQDKAEAKKVARVLERNGVDSIDRLINMTDDNILALKGIGARSMKIISTIKTRERYKAEKKLTEYKKLKGKQSPKNFRYYLQKAGCSYIEACNIERIVKINGCKTVDHFMNTKPVVIGTWKGIGPKRLEKIILTMNLIEEDRKLKTK